MRNEIIRLGGTVIFGAKFTDFTVKNGRISSAIYEHNGEKTEIETKKDVCKVIMVGMGLATHTRIASKVFKTLSDNCIKYSFISISEISISFVVKEEFKERVVGLLAEKFNL